MTKAVQWDSYALQYDHMCANNPAYQENIDTFLEFLEGLDLHPTARICDVGAGTGNYIYAASRILPGARYVHIDFDAAMNSFAVAKYEAAGLDTVDIIQRSIHDVDFTSDRFDVVLCVNSLYAMGYQERILTKIRSWLRPNGRLFAIDLGRPQRTADWASYIYWEMVKRRGVTYATRAILGGLGAAKQNRLTRRGQGNGNYWLHSTQEFASALRSCGFNVEVLRTCYREYCDLAICEPQYALEEVDGA